MGYLSLLVIDMLTKENDEKKACVGENSDFIHFIQTAKLSNQMRAELVCILELDPFSRRSLLNTYLSNISLQGGPKSLVSALSCLLDDRVASKALEVLNKEYRVLFQFFRIKNKKVNYLLDKLTQIFY